MTARSGPCVAVFLTLSAAVLTSNPGRAEVDWPVRIALPRMDLAVGATAGVAFDAGLNRGRSGVLGGVRLSLLHDALGAHITAHTHREGQGVRVGIGAEITCWYLALFGLGVSREGIQGEPGAETPDQVTTLTMLLAVPIPLWRTGGTGGTWVLMPYMRPGWRLAEDGATVVYHHAGVTLGWTSYGFGR